MNSQQSLWRSLFSLGTLLTGLAAVAVWSQEFDWQAGLYLVLLLYIHEAGHVLAARWRRVRVGRPPVFLPGLGAFVMVGATPRWLDGALVSLGGPLVGGLAAVAARQAGVAGHLPALAFAGDLALVVNLLNLAPMPGLDGGRVADLAGWLALVPTAGLLGYAFWAHIGFLQGVGIVLAGFQVFRLWNKAPDQLPAWGQALGALGLHALAIVLLAVPLILTARIPWLRAQPHQFQPLARTLTWVLLVFWLAGQYIWRAAWRSEFPAWMRYGAVTFGAWLQILLGNAWCWPISAAAFTAALASPAMAWLERLLQFLARRQNAAAGYAYAVGYDLLRSTGRPAEADAWLERYLPLMRDPESLMLTGAADQFMLLQYESLFRRFMLEVGERHTDPDSLRPLQANNIAWALFRAGRFAEALPYARAAVTGQPTDAALDTLGQVLEALGEYNEAETVLRRAWKQRPYVGSGLALARALAGQGRYPEAIQAAERAMGMHKGPWPADEISPADVTALIAQWQAAAS